jgi:HPt (histidine-containing phosphotransfer) domain-containing protein
MNSEITIPDEVRKMYVERRHKDLSTLKNSLAERKLDEFKRIGHQLKGNAASFGHSDLEKIAIGLEIAGDKQDLFEARKQVDLFESWLTRTSASL